MQVYKVLDLRSGEYFMNYWSQQPSHFCSYVAAENSITAAVCLSKTKLIREYFEIVEVESPYV